MRTVGRRCKTPRGRVKKSSLGKRPPPAARVSPLKRLSRQGGVGPSGGKDGWDLIAIPGGMPGAERIRDSEGEWDSRS